MEFISPEERRKRMMYILIVWNIFVALFVFLFVISADIWTHQFFKLGVTIEEDTVLTIAEFIYLGSALIFYLKFLSYYLNNSNLPFSKNYIIGFHVYYLAKVIFVLLIYLLSNFELGGV